MKIINEAARAIPVIAEVDLVVVGGSCTGVFAAVRAARLGLKVAIVKRHNCFGGTATTGNVNIWHSLHDTTGEQQTIHGLTHEIIERLARRNAVITTPDPSAAFILNTEELKIELDELVTSHKILPFLHTLYAAPVKHDGVLSAIAIENISGRSAIRARQFIDASGDGKLAHDLNVPAQRFDMPQPPTTCAKILGLDGLGEADWSSLIRQYSAEFGLAEDWGWGCPIPGMTDIKMRADTHVVGYNTLDGLQLSLAEIEGRRQIRAIMDIIRKYCSRGNTIALVDLAAMMGIREGRRFITSYQLTGSDILSGRKFVDAIANGTYRVDIHQPDGTGAILRYLDGTEEIIGPRGCKIKRRRWREETAENPSHYQIPWSSLLQPTIPNLVLAGRILHADREAFSAARVMVNMNQTGEAAGVACALALQQGVSLQNLNVGDIRKMLGI